MFSEKYIININSKQIRESKESNHYRRMENIIEDLLKKLYQHPRI